MHKDIQNELIELMAKRVFANKLESIRSSKFFGILADEYTDIKLRIIIQVFSMDHRSRSSWRFCRII